MSPIARTPDMMSGRPLAKSVGDVGQYRNSYRPCRSANFREGGLYWRPCRVLNAQMAYVQQEATVRGTMQEGLTVRKKRQRGGRCK